MSGAKKIVIIGAGYAGVHGARKLAKKYKKDDSVEITLIDRHSYHTMMTELHEVAGGRVDPNAIQYDLRRLFRRSKVKLVTDNVTNVDHDKKIVTTENGTYEYDYLVLGMGAEANDFGTPGVKEHGFTLWSWEDAVKLRNHIIQLAQKAPSQHNDQKRREMLTFVVCGSGFTGIEMIGELIEWRDRLAKDNKLDPKEIRLMVIEAAPTILNLLERKDADLAEKYMKKQGVEILTNVPIVQVGANSITLKSGEEIPTQTLIWTAGIQANSDTKDYGMSKGRAGRLIVNEYMEAEGLKDVYVIGDLAYLEEENGKPTPQIVEAAEQTGTTAAKNIIAEISGGEKHSYKGNYHGFMVSIGARYGVAHLGNMHFKGWLAIFIKHLVNLYYFFGIRSGYYMWQYIQHEFFHAKEKRQIFRGTLNRHGNVLWSIPLRIFLAGFWINEGLSKLYGEETWGGVKAGFENMVGFFGQTEEGSRGLFNAIGNIFTVLGQGIGEDSWLLSETVKMPFEWLQTAATSGATPDVAEGATALAAPILSHSPDWFQAIMRIMLPTPEVAVFMQRMMVFIEIGIGLAILVGLFTWLANAASVAFLSMFLLCAMLGWDKIWALPASIALMNGAGRTIGLDYFVIPWLSKAFGRWWYGDVRAIYQDRSKE